MKIQFQVPPLIQPVFEPKEKAGDSHRQKQINYRNSLLGCRSPINWQQMEREMETGITKRNVGA